MYGKYNNNYHRVKKNYNPLKIIQVSIPMPKVEKQILGPTKPLLNTSGQVVLGMIIEEVITVSLIPLAKHHAARCFYPKNEDEIFINWTKPPEEAIQAYLELCQAPITYRKKS